MREKVLLQMAAGCGGAAVLLFLQWLWRITETE
jgi:hypothetical protein